MGQDGGAEKSDLNAAQCNSDYKDLASVYGSHTCVQISVMVHGDIDISMSSGYQGDMKRSMRRMIQQS